MGITVTIDHPYCNLSKLLLALDFSVTAKK